jgi:tetratricopeptide (TPR) repeat protein
MDPTSTPLPWYRGIANFSLGNIEEAFEDFKRAYEIHPNHIHVLNNLGTCHELLGRHNDAIRCYHEVLNISPEFQPTLANLTAVYHNLGKDREGHDTLTLFDQKDKEEKVLAHLRTAHLLRFSPYRSAIPHERQALLRVHYSMNKEESKDRKKTLTVSAL